MTITAPSPTAVGTDRALWMFVPGKAVPQGSKNVYPDKRGGFVLVESSARTLAVWRDQITIAAIRSARRHHWDPPPPHTPLSTMLLFRMTRPRRSTLDTPTSRPDLDKLTRAVHDSLTDARIWHDDSQVVSSSQYKIWAIADQAPGLIIIVRRATTAAATERPAR